MKRFILCLILFFPLSSSAFAHSLLRSSSSEFHSRPAALTLKQAIQIALQKNPEILMAEGKLEKAGGELQKTKARTMPILALHGFAFTGNTITMIDTPTISPMGWITTTKNGNFGGDAAFSYPLYTGGYLKELVKSSRFRKFSQKDKLKAARLDVIFKTAQAYDGVLWGEADLKTALSDLKRSKESYRLAQEFFKAGKVPYFYLLRSRARRAESREKEIQAKNDLNLREIQLSNVLGETSVLKAIPSGKLTISVYPVFQRSFPSARSDSSHFPAILRKLLKIAYQNRPDSLAVRSEIDQVSAELKSIKGSYFPQVYFYGRYDSLSNSPGAFNGYNVGIHASVSLFDGGERKGEIREAKGMLKVEKGELKRIRLKIKNQTAQGFLNEQTALKELAAARQEVKFAKENLRIVMLRFRSGKGIFLEVLDAEDALTKARYQEIQALYDLNVSQAYLGWAVGMPIWKNRKL